MLKTVIVCDNCKKQYDENNGWYCIDEQRDQNLNPELRIAKLSDCSEDQDFELYRHLCGRECLIQAVSQWLDKRS